MLVIADGTKATRERVTGIRQLAEALGLSVTTVSRALAGYDDVSDATRKRVLEAARVAGYVPNAAAQRLRMGKAGTLAFFLPVAIGAQEARFLGLLAGASEEASLRGSELTTFSSHDDKSDLSIIRDLVVSRRADAIILPRVSEDDERVKYLIDAAFPFVTYGRTKYDDRHAWLDVDSEGAFFRTTKRLIELGHRRITLLSPPGFRTAALRMNGFKRALAASGLPLAETSIVISPSLTQEAFQCASALLTSPTRPSAIICPTHNILSGAMLALTMAGLSLGRDITLVSRYGLDINAAPVSDSLKKEGRALAEAAFGLAAGSDIRTHQMLNDFDLVIHQGQDNGLAV